MKEYARRAAEYQATSWGEFDASERETVERFVAGVLAGRILDIGCGTGYLTRLFRGRVVALDQSSEMLELSRALLPNAEFVQADVPPLPFPDHSFDLVFSSAVYSHIDRAAVRIEFVTEALRVARTLVVLEQAWRPGRERESWELRRLLDGSEHRVFKRYFTADELARELHGAVVLASPELLAVRARAWHVSTIGYGVVPPSGQTADAAKRMRFVTVRTPGRPWSERPRVQVPVEKPPEVCARPPNLERPPVFSVRHPLGLRRHCGRRLWSRYLRRPRRCSAGRSVRCCFGGAVLGPWDRGSSVSRVCACTRRTRAGARHAAPGRPGWP